MDKDTLTSLFQYHYWANRQLWRSLAALSDAQFAASSANGGPSIQAQAVGMVAHENLWVNYLWHGEVEFLEAAQFPTRASIRQEWDALEEEVLDFISELSPAELSRRVEPPFLGRSTSLQVWETLVYVVHHAVEQRAQVCQHLRQIGTRPLAHDFLAFAAEHAHHGYSYPAFALARVAQEPRR
ncbi:MAG TPA: DinB family protein [Steroidobacter sp.]|nr:DinB family protein [Steroidobacter sp.]